VLHWGIQGGAAMRGGGEIEQEVKGDVSGLGRRWRGEEGKEWAGWAFPHP